MKDRTDFREDWFMNQWYSKEELERLWNWSQKSGFFVQVILHNDKWSGFHIEDENLEIDLAGQPTEEDCTNWMTRLGFEVVPITELRKKKINKIVNN
jgi:hypothetical protein